MDLLHHAPALTRAEAAALARRLYGIDAEASPLPSERDQNVRLSTPVGDRFVLKIRPPMPFTRENGDHLAATLDDVLAR